MGIGIPMKRPSVPSFEASEAEIFELQQADRIRLLLEGLLLAAAAVIRYRDQLGGSDRAMSRCAG